MTLLFLCVACLAPAAAFAEDVSDILGRMRQALEAGKDMRAAVEFEIANGSGDSVRWAGSYYRNSGPNARTRLVFDSPPDLRGTAITVQRASDGATHTYVYLPAIHRVRDLQGDMRGESFLGTDFNYEDVGFEPFAFQQHALRGGGHTQGRDCYLVESIPDYGWWYGKILRYVDKETYLPLRTEYHDRSGILWKVRTLDVVETIGSHPTPTQLTMGTVASGTSTRITLRDVAYDTGFPESLFEDVPTEKEASRDGTTQP
jgi:outer membrane lipoprotein-sorting protein